MENLTYQKPITTMLPYDASAHKVVEIAKWFLYKEDPKIIFTLDPEIKRLYRLLTLYFTDNPEFETYFLKVDGGKILYSLRKGILLIGPTGRSKTFCFEKIFKYFTVNFMPSKKYRVVNSHTVQTSFEKNGINALKEFRKNANNDLDDMYIDEIGMEEFTVQHFGNKQSPIGTLLHERHRLYTSYGYKTHASSNLKLNSDKNEINFKSAYGERNYSRLYEMFNIIFVKGDDLRIQIIPD